MESVQKIKQKMTKYDIKIIYCYFILKSEKNKKKKAYLSRIIISILENEIDKSWARVT